MNLVRSLKLNKLRLTIQKRNLSFIELGNGDPLLDPIILCHGLLGNKNNFGTVGRELHKRTGRTVFSLDMVNHGTARRSDHVSYQDMADEIDLAIDELADGSAVLIGHSMGGRVVMWEAEMSGHPCPMFVRVRGFQTCPCPNPCPCPKS